MGDTIITSNETDSNVAPGQFSRSHVDTRSQTFGAFLIYLALSLLFFGRPLVGHFSGKFIGRESDPSQMMWLLAWWPYALSHHVNPFLTDYVWAPVGFNFAWMTSIPLPALVAAPLTASIGLVATYNILVLLSAPSAAICTFALCRRLSGSFWPSMLGGFVFGFSSFMIGQMLGHLCLILSFPVPLAAYLISRRLESTINTRRFIVLMAAVLISQFLIDIEMFATATVVGTLGFGTGWRFSSPEIRRRLLKLIPEVGAAFAVTVVVVSPYLYYFFGFGMLQRPLYPSEKFSTDLLNFIVPTPTHLVGTIRWLARMSSNFTGTVMERNGFVALPLILIAIAWARRHWKEPLCKSLVTSTLVVGVCAIGPYLQINGSPTIAMPWLASTHVPLFEHALPSRLMVFPPLALAVIVSLWLVDPQSRREVKLVGVVLTVFLMLPNPSAQFWATPVDTPSFFTDGSAQRCLSRQDVVLTLPWGISGRSMQWQAECGMCFRNVSGWTGLQRFQVRRWPVVNYFLGSLDLPEPELQLKAFLANTGVTAIVVDDAKPKAAGWETLIDTLGVEPRRISGVSLYKLSSDLLADYRAPRYSGVEMERRAIQTRFATLVTAADNYLQSGHDPRQLSDNELIDLSLLPSNWRREPTAFSDMGVMPWGNGGAIILELGSRTALADTMARFSDDANVVYLPFPRIVAGNDGMSPLALAVYNALLPPAATPIDGESMEVLGMAFDRERLHKAAGYIGHVQSRKSSLVSLARR